MSKENNGNVHQFHVLKEIDLNKNSRNTKASDFNEEMETMLSDGFHEELKSPKRKRTEDNTEDGEKPYEEKDKRVLVEKEQKSFDILPEGWIQITHDSGMPLYLHKDTRACTLAKPYFIGSGSARNHKIPLNAIPCLSYRRALEKEALKEQDPFTPKIDLTNIGGLLCPDARIETSQENFQTHSLTPDQVTEYCQALFKFKTIKVKSFKSWNDRKVFTKKSKQVERPVLPDGTKLLTIPMPKKGQDPSGNQCLKKEWVINPNVKNYVSMLHEYVQHIIKKPPSYKFVTLANDVTPHMATVTINNVHYGVGLGSSKKVAKNQAAKATLEIFIPEMNAITSTDDKPPGCTTSNLPKQNLSIFDEVIVEDPRVAELCAKAAEPSPYEILETCVKQIYFKHSDMEIKYHWDHLNHREIEFTMTVEKHTSTVVCKNKRDGKQRAAQAILQAIHPQITSWGSILKLYGSKIINKFTEKKKEEKNLQSKHHVTQPNYAILNKLKQEMTKLKKSSSQHPLQGTYTAPDYGKSTPSSSKSLNRGYM